MAYILLGIGVFLVGLSVVHWFVSADPKAVRQLLAKAGIAVLIVAALALIFTGRIGAAVLLLTLGAALTRFGPRQHSGRQGQSGPAGGDGRVARPVAGRMSADEALEVLGLSANASRDQIKAAHRKLITKLHPDHGGTADLAARVNDAKEVLLRRLK